MSAIEQTFWRYARGDLGEPAFEAWLYDTVELERVLSPEDFLAVVGADYRDQSPRARRGRIDKVREIVSRMFPPRCACLATPDTDTKSLGEVPVEADADVLAERNPFIRLARCRECGTHWLIGCDTVDDFVTVHRLAPPAAEDILIRDRWPTVFDDQPNYWPRTHDDTIRECTEIIRRDPGNARAFFSRGLAFVFKGDNEAALPDFNEAIRLQPEVSWPFVRRGDCHHARGDVDAALRDYTWAIGLDNDTSASMYAHRGRGDLYRLRGDFARAIADYDRVLGYAPRFAGAFVARGMAYAGLRQFDRAIQDFGHALQAARRLQNEAVAAEALYRRAMARMRCGDLVGCGQDLAAARSIDVGLVDAWVRRDRLEAGS